MIKFLVQLLKKTFFPYKIKDPVLQLELWQYMALLTLVGISFFFTWIVLSVLRRTLAMRGRSLQSMAKFERYTYPFTSLGSILYARSLLELPLIPFWQNIFLGLNIIFAVVALVAVNRLMDVAFVMVNRRMQRANWDTLGILQVFSGVAKFVALTLTLVLVSSLFFDYNMSGLLANLSIGAGTLTAVVAFASKDLVSNFFGALVVTVGKPFKIGDWIIVNGLQGRVHTIDMRTTKLRMKEGTMVYIPNSTFISKNIHNYGPTVYTKVGLKLLLMEAKPQALISFWKELDRMIEAYPALITSRTNVQVDDFTAEKTNVTLHCYFKKVTEQEKMQHMRALLDQVMTFAKKEGVTLQA